MLGHNGKPHKVHSNPYPNEVRLRRYKPYRSEPNEDGGYTSYFCDSCKREFEVGEEAIGINTYHEEWEEDPIFHDYVVCLDCYEKPLRTEKG